LNWQKIDLEFFKSKDYEIAMSHYPVKPLGELRVVCIKAKRSLEEINERRDFFEEFNPEEHDYRHYSLITNVDVSEMNNEEVFNFHKDRATTESCIREQKHGFDF
jgi:hypothetical protein